AMHICELINSLSIVLLIIFFVGGLASCEADPFPRILLPVHPDAISTKRINDKPVKGAKAVVYNVSVQFPATKIIEFYNRELVSMGYVPLNATIESRPLGIWSSINNRTGKFEEVKKAPGLYIAHWVDNSKETWIWLVISYKFDGADPSWDNTAIVSCNIAKYSTYEEGIRIKELMKDKTHNK
ncbi:MAG: hypothetical protein SVY10_04465, partial [Thermodesulfobacteriota bacterium]|nr:hypothetical protein [Thermodesulfobacteriota bacterium]